MPSYRVTLTIGALLAGNGPAEVLPAASHAARDVAVLEAADVSVVAGAPRITVRFTADDNDIARQVSRHVVASTAAVARVTMVQITLRSGNRWDAVSWE
ncbi:hypothetical protein [Lysinibacter cavernae]|uniref:Asp23/Gls24 family envelope stress response protein n=1 Tax=Lysinibacter cavernae TaxID=1640652 RepID=A0A7X5R1S1_9MICO|nr:hypothetical protein [Lysinibacter cavernae]NIH54013.1 hypothetical protein [Lysinibacter cavernae]